VSPELKIQPMPEANHSSAKRILCIEDDRDTCEMLGFLLSEYDFKFIHNPEKIFPLIEAKKFDLYILDNWLPGASGVELCRKIRALDERVPVIFTSGSSLKKDIQAAFDAGANKYLVKPYEPEELRQIVKELIYKD
jgi:DNA-binding response OmpR family regulator